MKFWRSLVNFYYAKRYKLYKVVNVDNVTIYFYWKLNKTRVKSSLIRTNIRKYSEVDILLKLNLRKEIRDALSLRILKKS